MSRATAASMLPQEDAELEIDPDPALEHEAEEAVQRAMQGGPVTVNRMGAEVHVQRWAGSSASSQIAAERGETGYKSDPRATGTVASNRHYRHSTDGSIDTENLELSGDGTIEQLQAELDGALDRRYIGASLIVASVVAADFGEQVAQEKLADAFDLAPPQARAIVVAAGAAGAAGRFLLHRFDKYPVRWVASKLGVKAEVEEVLIRAGFDVPWAEEEPESVPDPEEVDE